jgi:proline-specific peptidase
VTAGGPTHEGFVSLRGHQVWYRVVGEREEPARSPLLCLHGGPGATHDYLAPLEDMTGTGRRVVLYDQLGWGNSDHASDPALWTVDLFLEELGVVRDALDLEHVHLLGHSWGGMLALEYALTRPEGLASLILADTMASTKQWLVESARLIAQLPPDVQETIRLHQEQGTTDSPEYEEACKAFSRRHGGGHVHPRPEWVKKAFAKLEVNEIYLTMWGPSEFCAIGTLKDWDITARLGEIHVPALVIAGRHDEATPVLAETLLHGIPDSQCVIFEESAHFPHIEETERYLAVLDRFLSDVEARA